MILSPCLSIARLIYIFLSFNLLFYLYFSLLLCCSVFLFLYRSAVLGSLFLSVSREISHPNFCPGWKVHINKMKGNISQPFLHIHAICLAQITRLLICSNI